MKDETGTRIFADEHGSNRKIRVHLCASRPCTDFCQSKNETNSQDSPHCIFGSRRPRLQLPRLRQARLIPNPNRASSPHRRHRYPPSILSLYSHCLPSSVPHSHTPPTLSPTLVTGHIVYVCFVDGFDNICLMDANGANPRRLTTTAATDFYPSLSPDGQWIAFSTRRDNNFEIYVMNVDGSDPRRLTQNMGSNFAPALSPNGSKIAFVSAQGGNQNIWLMDADGANPVQLTEAPINNFDPTWSPDGGQIAFASDRGGTSELYLMNADGTNVRQVTFDLNVGGRNDWSADGGWLTFYAGEEGDRDIFVMSVDRSNQRPVIPQLAGTRTHPEAGPGRREWARDEDGEGHKVAQQTAF